MPSSKVSTMHECALRIEVALRCGESRVHVILLRIEFEVGGGDISGRVSSLTHSTPLPPTSRISIIHGPKSSTNVHDVLLHASSSKIHDNRTDMTLLKRRVSSHPHPCPIYQNIPIHALRDYRLA